MERGWAGAAQCVAASVRLRISGWRGMVAASARWWGLGLEGGPPAGAAVRRWLRRAEIFLGFTPIGNGEAFCTGSLVGGFVNALSASMWCGRVNTGNRSRGSLSGAGIDIGETLWCHLLLEGNVLRLLIPMHKVVAD